MLLKGWRGGGQGANPRAAAEMVLIRLAYTADLPAPDEVIRRLAAKGRWRAAASRRRATTAARATRRSIAPRRRSRDPPRRRRISGSDAAGR